MKVATNCFLKRILLFTGIFLLTLSGVAPVCAYPVRFTDSQGYEITITGRGVRTILRPSIH